MHYIFYIHYIFDPCENLRSIKNFYSHSADEETGTKLGYAVQDHRTFCSGAGIYTWVSDCKANALNPSLLQFLFVIDDNRIVNLILVIMEVLILLNLYLHNSQEPSN